MHSCKPSLCAFDYQQSARPQNGLGDRIISHITSSHDEFPLGSQIFIPGREEAARVWHYLACSLLLLLAKEASLGTSLPWFIHSYGAPTALNQ
eukprot:scaffold4707_cov164-Amphora_coffeaeformis.AAC.26